MADNTGVPLQDIITYAGMAVGAGIAALLVRLGWKKPPVQDLDLAISGQATIADMSPVRQLLKQVDLLTLQLQKTVIALEAQSGSHTDTVVKLSELADLLGAYIAIEKERQEEEDREAEVQRRVAERLRDHGIET